MEEKKEKEESLTKQLYHFAGSYKYLSILSTILAAISAFVALVPFYYIWKVMQDVLRVRFDFSKAAGISTYGWRAVGFAILGMIIYMAAITGINSELYDAVKVDGANRLQAIIHVTIPRIKPTIVTMLIMSVGRLASIGFDRPFVMGTSLVLDYSDVISTFVYRIGIQSAKYNVAAAVGLFQSVINIALLLSADRISKKINDQGIF